MSVATPINLHNLKIARENAGYTTLEATKRACGNVKQDRVEQWESGTATPTWTQLKNLAHCYDVNIFLLAGEETITRNREIADYRNEAGAAVHELNTKKFINFLLQRQRYLESIMKSDGVKENEMVGSITERDNPERAAREIAQKIDYTYKPDIPDTHLKYLISLLESRGVFVMKTLSYWGIDVTNMRGVYLKNKYAPVIGLNRKDTKTGQLFTLAHEMAHLFINSEGVSNIDFRDQSNNPTERFCNAVAANLLLPKDKIEPRTHDIFDIQEIAKTYQVSELFVFYRLRNLNLIDRKGAVKMENGIKERSKKNATRQSGGDANNNMKDSNGGLFNHIISSLYFEKRLNAAEASKILRLSIDKV